MKKLLVLATILVSTISLKGETPFTNGILVNPTAGTVLAQLAPAVEGETAMSYSWVVCSNVAAILTIEKRSSTETILWSQAYTVGANDCREPARRLISFNEGDYISLRLTTGITSGRIQATIFKD